MIYADIIIDISSDKLDRSFQYRVPERLEKKIKAGMVAAIPFGNAGRVRKGYVIGLSDKPKIAPEKIKEISEICSGEETTESRLIALAAWMRENYGSTMIQALRTVLPIQEKIKAKEKKYICLDISEEAGAQLLKELEQTRFKARTRLLRELLEKKRLDYTHAAKELGTTSAVVKKFQEQGIIRIEYDEIMRTSLNTGDISGERRMPLTDEQEAAVKQIQREWKKPSPKPVLIEGVTGSGKTQVYIKLIEQTLSQGKEVIVLIPEIALTYQTVRRFYARFGDKVSVINSRQSQGERYDQFKRATPSVEAYSKAMNGEYSLVRLTTRYGSRPLPRVSIVDLREELKAGNRSVLSRELRQKMKGRFEKKEQVMLFLNRRGYAGFVSCRSCGHVMKCPHCDVSLSEHNNERLLCHYCGYETGKPRICPVCGSPYIGGFKAGTQQIEKVVREDFPEVRTLRMDFDTTRTKGSYEKILAAFAAHEADILIGTQMIVKGHDFPDVTLMGIVAADLSLNAEDYRCAERTFQLLCQAVGRGGRGEKPGEAVIQTYHPDHYSIQAAAVQDYQAFYEEEMSYRMLLDYPPAAHMLAVLGSGPEDEKLVQAMYYLKLYIERIYRENDLHIIGPAYASVGKVKDIYRQVIYLKHKDHKTLVHIKDQLEKYIEINSGFRKIYIQFDFS